jgi:hypothetical protein
MGRNLQAMERLTHRNDEIFEEFHQNSGRHRPRHPPNEHAVARISARAYIPEPHAEAVSRRHRSAS